MNKHTRGPWKVISEETAKEVEVFEVAEISHFRVICDGLGDGFDKAGDAYLDARLIAAAPEMLAALMLAESELEADSPAAIAVSAAIAKATGDAT